MREHEKAEAYNQAIDLMVDEAVATKRPASPGAYAATVRADLRDRMRDRAREAFAKYGDLSAEHLAVLLAAAEKPEPDPEPAMSAAPLEPWTGPAVDDDAGPVLTRQSARERVAEIKAQLSTVTKQPIPTNQERSA